MGFDYINSYSLPFYLLSSLKRVNAFVYINCLATSVNLCLVSKLHVYMKACANCKFQNANFAYFDQRLICVYLGTHVRCEVCVHHKLN